jgi:glycosylphosphatidylinositol transamidase (GPIT) subunit GPI8
MRLALWLLRSLGITASADNWAVLVDTSRYFYNYR